MAVTCSISSSARPGTQSQMRQPALAAPGPRLSLRSTGMTSVGVPARHRRHPSAAARPGSLSVILGLGPRTQLSANSNLARVARFRQTSSPTTCGTMGPRDEPEDDTCRRAALCVRSKHLRPRGLATRGFASSFLLPLYETGTERQGPYRCKYGDAAPAAPHCTNGLPATSPGSSTPRGEPAYAYRWQQTRHGFADVSCPFAVPDPAASRPARARALFR